MLQSILTIHSDPTQRIHRSQMGLHPGLTVNDFYPIIDQTYMYSQLDNYEQNAMWIFKLFTYLDLLNIELSR